jgi:hypothetical protein
MNRTNLIFIIAASTLLGCLVGVSIVLDNDQTTPEKSQISVTNNKTSSKLIYRFIDSKDFPIEKDDFGKAKPATLGENFISSKKPLKHEIIEITLPLDSGIEYKANMLQGDSIVYSWSTKNEKEVYYDFHAHPNVEDNEFFTRYRMGEASTNQGSIVSAYKGQHGWYWLNISGGPIVIELEISGFYEDLVRIQP